MLLLDMIIATGLEAGVIFFFFYAYQSGVFSFSTIFLLLIFCSVGITFYLGLAVHTSQKLLGLLVFCMGSAILGITPVLMIRLWPLTLYDSFTLLPALAGPIALAAAFFIARKPYESGTLHPHRH